METPSHLTAPPTAQSPPRTRVVAFLGSSTTAGVGQAFNWIGELETRPRNAGFRFYNFGVGGDLAYNALQRLPRVIACHPDKVVIIFGSSNDVLIRVFKNLRPVLGLWKHLPTEPSPEWFRQNLQSLVRRLEDETDAQIGLASLSLVGEDPDSTNPVQHHLNVLFAQYSNIIKQVAQAEMVRYIPFYERLHEQIVTSPGRAFTAFGFLPFYRDTFRFFVLRRSGEEIARQNGWRFHVDGVHLNRRGGLLLADLVQEFLDG